MDSKRIVVYIDGENLIHQLVESLKGQSMISDRVELVEFQLRNFFEEILSDISQPDEIRYYGTRLREYRHNPDVFTRSRRKIAWTSRWMNTLQSQNIKYVKSGILKVKDGEECIGCGKAKQIFQEKGVDVRIATDIVFDTFQKTVGTIVLVSSDTDLLPALQRVSGRVNIIYVTHESRITRTITQLVSRTRTYTDAAVQKHFIARKQTIIKDTS